MELDSASPNTVVPYCFYTQHFGQLVEHASAYTFRSYSNSDVHILSFVAVSMFLINSRKRIVVVYVSKIDSNPLLGRNAFVLLNVLPCVSRITIASVNLHLLRFSYQNIFLPDIARVPKAMHRIRLSADYKPFSISQSRPVPLAQREALSQAFKNMVTESLIKPMQCSECVHPLTAVQKKGGSTSVCTDLRVLNRLVIVDTFPLLSLDELMVSLPNAKLFAKLDIRSAYNHMPLTPDCRHLTAVLAQYGLYQYNVLPMGLSSALAA
ncbi:unnamed protein product [Dicrocoelium dendriticum]|nr:unnamed protein product [Dicrocoelium dendriticum]